MANTIFGVGELLWIESPEGWSSIIFIDTPFESGSSSIYYSQIAHVEDFGSGLEVYLGFESGYMPMNKITRKVTDADLNALLELISRTDYEFANTISNWVVNVSNDNVVLEVEKERIAKLVKLFLAKP